MFAFSGCSVNADGNLLKCFGTVIGFHGSDFEARDPCANIKNIFILWCLSDALKIFC